MCSCRRAHPSLRGLLHRRDLALLLLLGKELLQELVIGSPQVHSLRLASCLVRLACGAKCEFKSLLAEFRASDPAAAPLPCWAAGALVSSDPAAAPFPFWAPAAALLVSSCQTAAHRLFTRTQISICQQALGTPFFCHFACQRFELSLCLRFFSCR